MATRRTLRRATSGVAVLSAGLMLAACGSDDDSSSSSGSDGEVSGELRTFTYADTVHETKLANFKKNNPDVEVRTATFESNDEAAAKIKAGFKADVVEVCLDEQGPLIDAGMLQPIDTSRLENWDDLDPTFRDAAGVAAIDGEVSMVPTQAGAVGIIYDKDEFPDGVDSWATLFDSEYDGRAAMDGGYWLTPFAIKAMANGNTDPMNLDDDEVARDPGRADRSARRPLPGVRSVGRRHGQPVQVRRDRDLRRRPFHRRRHRQGWRKRRLGSARRRRAVVGVWPEHRRGRRRTSTPPTPSSMTTHLLRRRQRSATTASW